jgi:hypothetical protein
MLIAFFFNYIFLITKRQFVNLVETRRIASPADKSPTNNAINSNRINFIYRSADKPNITITCLLQACPLLDVKHRVYNPLNKPSFVFNIISLALLTPIKAEFTT